MALKQAGAEAKGATAYVSLEPCAHHGETPPCAEALIAAGIARVIIAAPDPDPRVDGRGAEMLRAAGVMVDWAGVAVAERAAELNAGFLSKVNNDRPLVTLKLASTLDGRIATAGGESQWITGEEARARGHLLRAEHDAILVGIGTVLADDPELTCRLPGMAARSPVRVVLDSRLRLPSDSRLARGAKDHALWLLGGPGREAPPLMACGCEVITVPLGADGRIDLVAALQSLAGRGITRLLVEGGSAVATAFLAAGLVDNLAWFRAPSLIGGDGLPVFGALGLTVLAHMPRFQRQGIESLGDDVLESYVQRG
jgi:diaminohydroxyphosphoribosylaminopyrimidine deaminase/5-amino-6-(5-phosphoribosylamino)uracil reductase